MIKKRPRTNAKEVIECAISSMQQVLAMDFKASDVEVGVVTKDNPVFRYACHVTRDESEDSWDRLQSAQQLLCCTCK